MAKNKTHKIKINLGSSGKQTVGKVVYGWTIDAGRAIIVGIELIALLALGYRFIIDRQIVDLHKQIETEEKYIAATALDEKNYQSIHDRLKNIKAIDQETSAKIQIMNRLLEAISNGTFFSTNLNITNRSISMDGNTFSVLTLTEFLESLKGLPSVASISIDEVGTTGEGIRFKTRINIKDLTQGVLDAQKEE